MNTITADKGIQGISWRVNPFEELHKIWAELVGFHSAGGRTHMVGSVEEVLGSIVEVELNPVAFEKEVELFVKDGTHTLFVVPVDIMEGIEGAYLRILDVLRRKQNEE
ncbi:hypothetical protein [Thermococcus sp.]|uniref:hypothetical protein n=1 Tax=Thermococcus sp. TaxID=35749 RepID=UPI002617BBB8|nr:hypothetical protein [Thermococcus sp.]